MRRKLLLAGFISLNLLTSQLVASECEAEYTDHIVHYADEDNHQTPSNRLITINYDTMELLEAKNIPGVLNHHADPVGYVKSADYMLLIPKGSNFLSAYEIKSGKFVKRIRLPFRPRSADAYNPKKNLLLLTSRDRPSAVLIDTKELKIVGFAGFNIECNQEKANPYNTFELIDYKNNFAPNFKCHAPDFGGDQISGHPIWISGSAFAILDRANRKIEVYKIRKFRNWYKTRLIQVIKTDTSLHQLIPKDKSKFNNRIFYGSTEGNIAQNKVAGVYKFVRFGNYLIKTNFTKLKFNEIDGFAGHNLYITPDLKYLYTPSGVFAENSKLLNKGGIFVIDSKTMKIKKAIQAGLGAGHVAFSKQKGIAIVTNHKDNFLTAIDYKEHDFIKNIYLDFPRANIASLTQSHMQHVSEDGEYYYNFWSDGGVFFRVNLSDLEVDSYVKVGGVPIQGNFYDKVAIHCDLPPLPKDDGYDFFFGKNSIFTKYNGFKYKIRNSNEVSKFHNDYEDRIKKLKDFIHKKIKKHHKRFFR